MTWYMIIKLRSGNLHISKNFRNNYIGWVASDPYCDNGLQNKIDEKSKQIYIVPILTRYNLQNLNVTK